MVSGQKTRSFRKSLDEAYDSGSVSGIDLLVAAHIGIQELQHGDNIEAAVLGVVHIVGQLSVVDVGQAGAVHIAAVIHGSGRGAFRDLDLRSGFRLHSLQIIRRDNQISVCVVLLGPELLMPSYLAT